MSLPADLLEILVCPTCRGRLALGAGPAAAGGPARETLECRACRVAYPVQDGIPILIADDAQPLPA